jgi:hypothetical protein
MNEFEGGKWTIGTPIMGDDRDEVPTIYVPTPQLETATIWGGSVYHWFALAVWQALVIIGLVTYIVTR